MAAAFRTARDYNSNMMRPVACLLLITSLLTQGAALPHTHAGSEMALPAGHDLRPHFHLSGAAHSHHVHHAAYRQPTLLSQTDEQANCFSAPPCDHDHDAVYLNAGGTVSVMEQSAGWAMLAVASVALVGELDDITPGGLHAGSLPCYGDHVPIFLASTRLLV